MWFATVSGECTRKASWPVGLARLPFAACNKAGEEDGRGDEGGILKRPQRQMQKRKTINDRLALEC